MRIIKYNNENEYTCSECSSVLGYTERDYQFNENGVFVICVVCATGYIVTEAKLEDYFVFDTIFTTKFMSRYSKYNGRVIYKSIFKYELLDLENKRITDISQDDENSSDKDVEFISYIYYSIYRKKGDNGDHGNYLSDDNKNIIAIGDAFKGFKIFNR
jgi:hypothetical protein